MSHIHNRRALRKLPRRGERGARPSRCRHPRASRMITFGLAGGGYGTYEFCLKCSFILWKIQAADDEA